MRSDNPQLLRLHRAGELESIHRGAWVLVDLDGVAVGGSGDPNQLVFARSSMKSLQALPLIESGAADRFGFDDRHLALALASHSGEPMHVEVAADGLARIGLDAEALQCGPQRPMHAGPEVEAEPAGTVQQSVRAAVAQMTDTPPSSMGSGVDGCSAPTFMLPLAGLALGLARVANPDRLSAERAAACRRLTEAARRHPDLVAGTTDRFCTDVIRASEGRVFAKIGAEGVYAFGVVGEGVGFAGKVDDGDVRGLYPIMVALLAERGFISEAAVEALQQWGSTVIRDRNGAEVGHIEIC